MTSENAHPDVSVRPVDGFGDEPTVRIDMRFISVPENEPAPVFSDQTGRRQRRLRWLAYGLMTVCAAYFVMVGVSIAGGSGLPKGLLPIPDLINNQDEEPAPPVTEPTPAVKPTATPSIDGRPDSILPERAVGGTRPTTASTTAATRGAGTPAPTNRPGTVPTVPQSGDPAPTDPVVLPTIPPDLPTVPPETPPPSIQPPGEGALDTR